jgi:hypothetical protein
MNIQIKPQQFGPIQYKPASIFNRKLTYGFNDDGAKVFLCPTHRPASLSGGKRYRVKPKFTREQRISAEKSRAFHDKSAVRLFWQNLNSVAQ